GERGGAVGSDDPPQEVDLFVDRSLEGEQLVPDERSGGKNERRARRDQRGHGDLAIDRDRLPAHGRPSTSRARWRSLELIATPAARPLAVLMTRLIRS